MQQIKIFLASSFELAADRNAFEIWICRQNKSWVDQGVFLYLTMWEDFLDVMSQTRLQDEYNKAIQGCDVFVMLFHSKVGLYTAEEFATAFKQFKNTSKPFILTYFKNTPVTTSPSAEDQASLSNFKQQLKSLGHFYTSYANTEGLCQHFGKQLHKLAKTGFLQFDPDTPATAPASSPQQTMNTIHGDVYTGGGDFNMGHINR